MNKKIYKNIQPVLNHGDFGPKHIMVSGETITGIIDWGQALGHSPIHDFARWDYWFGDEIPTEWLKDGYTNKKYFDRNFEHIFAALKLHIGLGVLWWYHEQNYPEAVEKAKKRLLRDLESYES